MVDAGTGRWRGCGASCPDASSFRCCSGCSCGADTGACASSSGCQAAGGRGVNCVGEMLGIWWLFHIISKWPNYSTIQPRSWTIGWNIEKDTCLMWILIDVVPKIERNWRFTSQDLCFWSTLGPDLGVQKLWGKKDLAWFLHTTYLVLLAIIYVHIFFTSSLYINM